MTSSARATFAAFHDIVGVGTPVTVTGLTVLGIGLQDWVYIFTIAVATSTLVRFVAWCVASIRKRRRAP